MNNTPRSECTYRLTAFQGKKELQQPKLSIAIVQKKTAA